MEGKFTLCPKHRFTVVDVREVAKAHVQAIETGKNGSRYILSNKNSTSVFELGQNLKEDYDKGYYLPIFQMHYIFLWILSFFNSKAGWILKRHDWHYSVANEKSIEDLKVNYRSEKESLLDMAENLIEIQYINDYRE